MKWQIPAKTFLLGEYAALSGASALLITTKPYFELELNPHNKTLSSIHPLSPAGLWWQSQNHETQGLEWYDPYQGRGGFGASSAQFITCYLATCHIQQKIPHWEEMLQAYYKYSWTGVGLKPSAYDVIAQSHRGCVYINKLRNRIRTFSWPFENLSIMLLHTGNKIATHNHLQNAALPSNTHQLSEIVDSAVCAFEKADAALFIKAINNYHQALNSHQLVIHESLQIINFLRAFPEVLAIKGCGALGADVILVLSTKENSLILRQKLKGQQFSLIATEADISPLQSSNLFTTNNSII